MSSLFKKAHKTHAFAQPAGVLYPQGREEGRHSAEANPNPASRTFTQLCERVPDAATRAALLGVSVEVEAAWQQGKQLPLLRARRKELERVLREL